MLTALQSKKAVTIHIESKQLLHLALYSRAHLSIVKLFSNGRCSTVKHKKKETERSGQFVK